MRERVTVEVMKEKKEKTYVVDEIERREIKIWWEKISMKMNERERRVRGKREKNRIEEWERKYCEDERQR